MTPHAARIIEHFKALDALLQTKGFPPTSPWWHATVERWYRSSRRQLVVRAGRRAGKSSTLSRLGVVEALYGDHKIPPGDTGVVAIISTRREEAAERIGTVRAILDALGVKYSPWGEHGVRLVGKPVGFRVFTASIAGVSGFTSVFVFADEVAKWKDADTGANPANEVIKSVRPTMLTMRNARIILSSSPMSKADAHYDAFELGENALQVVAHATSWEANPSVTKEDTHLLEPDTATWEREYAAIPQAELSEGLLTEALIVRAQRKVIGAAPPVDEDEEVAVYKAAIDPALKSNAFTLAVATRTADRKRRVVLCHQWIPAPKMPLVPSTVFREMKKLLEPYGIRAVHTDQHSDVALREIARQEGLFLLLEPWTQTNKAEAYEGLKTMLQNDEIELPRDAKGHIAKDLLGIRKVFTRSGVTYDLAKQGTRHSDYAPSIARVVGHAQTPAKSLAPEKAPTDEEHASKEKARFLRDLEKADKWADRNGTAPITHRFARGRLSVRAPSLWRVKETR